MNIQILQLLEGAKKATGVAVVIDVFRAFSVESYLFDGGAEKVVPVADINEAYGYKEKDSSAPGIFKACWKEILFPLQRELRA